MPRGRPKKITNKGNAKYTRVGTTRSSIGLDKDNQGVDDGRGKGQYGKKRTQGHLNDSATTSSESDSDTESGEDDRINVVNQSKRAKTAQTQKKPLDLVTARSKTVSSYTEDTRRVQIGTISLVETNKNNTKQPTVEKRVKETMENDIKRYIRDNFYKWVKFYINESKAQTHLFAGISAGSLSVPVNLGLTTDEYVQTYTPVVKSKLGELRRNSFQNVKGRYNSKYLKRRIAGHEF